MPNLTNLDARGTKTPRSSRPDVTAVARLIPGSCAKPDRHNETPAHNVALVPTGSRNVCPNSLLHCNGVWLFPTQNLPAASIPPLQTTEPCRRHARPNGPAV